MLRLASRTGWVLGVWALGALGARAQAADTPPAGITAQPLAPRPTRGKTLFEVLSPEATGVKTENRYADPRMWGDLYQEFSVGSIGTGVAIGDYDGDGRPDLYVVSKTEGCRLFRNLGNYKFEDVTEKAGVGATPGIWNQGATFVDINNDGLLDIYVCRFNAPNLLYVNQGDGTFKEMAHAYGLDVVDASVMASFADYDRDGWLDLYLATNLLNMSEHPHGQKGYLFHNNRNGTFTNVTERAGISGEAQSHSATWWDYDDDGWPDLYVANDFGTPDKLYHNNRDGTFTNVTDRVLPHTSFSSMGADLGDVNNDGLMDFFVSDMALTTHQKDQRTAADTRGRGVEPPDSSTAAPKYQRNALYINTGTGRFMEAACLAGLDATNWTWSVRFEDLDNDGRVDLFVTNGQVREQNNVDLITRMMSAESPAERIRIMHESPPMPESHLAFRNLGDLRFENVSQAWGLDQRSVAFGAAFGDLSGDGNLDLAYSNYQGGVTLLRNTGDSGHSAEVFLRGTVSNRFGIGATVRVESALGIQVRQIWLARGYLSSSEPMAHFGFGSDARIRQMTVAWPSGHVQTFEDLPVDQRFTVTEPSDPIEIPSVAQAPAARRFSEVGPALGLDVRDREEVVDETYQQRLIPVRLNRRGPALAVGDIDASGRDAVVVGGTTLDPLRILRPRMDGTFAGEQPLPAAPGVAADDGPVLLFDAQGRGFQDLLVTKGGNALPAGAPEFQPRLFFNDGRGRFSSAPAEALPPLAIDVGAVAAADFDRSGRLGLFIGGRLEPGQYPEAPRSALLANRGGRFEDVTDSLAPGLRNIGMVTSALWSDVDGDGWPDLLLTLEWGGVRYFHNNAGHGFEDWSEKAGFASAGTGWWTSIAAADFNGDGRMDYVVGNAGLNTPYRASAQYPTLLYSGDFRGDGSNQLIEAYYEDGLLYPRRSRRDLGAAIPSILKRFPRNDYYARATLGEILGRSRLSAAQKFAATELESGVFLSQPDGTYVFRPLPRIAQIAPFQGLAAGDFLGNAHADIYGVQNSYAPIYSIGNFDGGMSQMFLGDGKAGAVPLPPNESGLIVTGDAKALAVVDLDGDGWPDFVVTRNKAAMLAFRNRGNPDARPLRILLRGPAGNPTAVGARVSVTYADGSQLTAEVAAGSGYYSESAAGLYFGYPENRPPAKIRVRWPDGAETGADAAHPPAVLTLSEAP